MMRRASQGNEESFGGHNAKIDLGNTGRQERIDAYYGGDGTPDGEGHGHVVSNDGTNVNFWRAPGEQEPFIDDRRDSDPVRG